MPRRHAAFGAALARTHAAGAHAFGARPDGWDRTALHRPSSTARGRGVDVGRVLRPRSTCCRTSRSPRRSANTTAAEGRLVRRAADVIAAGAFDDDEPPARIHGDLWNGNVLWSPDGVVLIDPAAHGGHRETDLAMLALFGCPFLDDVLAAYDRAAPLRAAGVSGSRCTSCIRSRCTRPDTAAATASPSRRPPRRCWDWLDGCGNSSCGTSVPYIACKRMN